MHRVRYPLSFHVIAHCIHAYARLNICEYCLDERLDQRLRHHSEASTARAFVGYLHGLGNLVQDNLHNPGLDALAIVNLRVGGMAAPDETSIVPALTALAELREEGLIQHLGLSNVSQQQFDEARTIVPIVCVQNYYNVAHRGDDAFLDRLNAQGVAFVPFFPLGGFSPLQASALDDAAAELGVTPMAVTLASLLQRS